MKEAKQGFGASVPDLPGCIAAADSRAEVPRLIHGAIEFHLDGLRQDGLPIPVPHSSPELVEVSP